MWGCLDLWYGYDWWNETCFHSQFVSSIVDVILSIGTKKKKKEKKKESKWWRELLFMLQTVHVHNSSQNSKKGVIYTWYIQRWKLLIGVTSFTCLIHSSLSWFIFCSTSFDGFWAIFLNISHLDPKPHYNPWKILMIHVMHVILVVENEKICKPVVDHFHWNEFERNTYPSNTWESSVYFREGLRI